MIRISVGISNCRQWVNIIVAGRLNLKFSQKLEKFISYTIKLGGLEPQLLNNLNFEHSTSNFQLRMGM
jgi:hypothetical protein